MQTALRIEGNTGTGRSRPSPRACYEDPLEADRVGDVAVSATRRALCRVALVAAETATRFAREGLSHDPMAWMLAPRALFSGSTALEAFHNAHRAASDVDAVIALLRERPDGARTALGIMLENAKRPGWLIAARGAPFEMKTALRARGYRWDGRAGAWFVECDDVGKDRECRWLAANVYNLRRAKVAAPDVIRMDWTLRHGR